MKFYLIIILIFITWGCTSLRKTERSSKGHLSIEQQSEFDYQLSDALKQKMLGNYNRAELLLLKCLDLKPKNAVVYYELSLLFGNIGDKNSAVCFARKAVQNDPTNEWYLLQCAKLYQETGKVDSVIYFFKNVVTIRPDKYEYSFKLAQLYLEGKYFKKSIKILNRLELSTGPSRDIYFAEYRNYLALNDNKSCLNTLNKALKKFPDETRFYGLLAEHYASIGNHDQALINYSKLLSLDAEDERGNLSLIDFYRNSGDIQKSFYLSGRFISNEGFKVPHKIELIASYLNDEVCFSKNRTEIKMLIDSFLSKNRENLQGRTILANFYLKSNDLKNARTELSYLVANSNSDILVWEQLLFVLNSMNDMIGVYNLSDTAINLFKDNPLFYLYKGISAYQLKHYDVAISSLKHGLKFSDGSRDLLSKYYSYLGEAYNAVSDDSNSDYYFEKALSFDPKNFVILNNYSYYLTLRGVRLDSALNYSKRCLKVEPHNPIFLDTYAWVLYKIGKTNEAKTAIEGALSYGGNKNKNILEHYCEILLKLNMRESALECYKKIIELGKESPRIREILNLSK